MLIREMISLFLNSRKRGVDGAKRKCSDKTVQIYEYNLLTFANWLQTESKKGLTQYQNMTRLDLRAYLDWMDGKQKAGQWSVATVLQNLRSLRAFFHWIEKDEDCREEELDKKKMYKYLPPITKTPRRNDIPQVKDLKTFKSHINTDSACGFRDYVCVCFMMDTGARIGEVCNLTLDHMRLTEKMVIVDGKTGPRPIAITKDMVQLFKVWLKRRLLFKQAKESPYVFISKYRPKMDVSSWGKQILKLRRKYNLPRITAHSLRHAFATNYLRRGGNMEKCRIMLGHTSYDMMRDYLHLAEMGGQDMQTELEKVSLLKEVY